MAAAEPYTVVERGVAKGTAQDSKAFLESSPRCIRAGEPLRIGLNDGCTLRTRPRIIRPTIMSPTHRGPYSTARTVAGSRVFELDAHVNRLATTAGLMWPDDQNLPAAMTDPAKLRPLLLQTLRTAILHYRCVFSLDDGSIDSWIDRFMPLNSNPGTHIHRPPTWSSS